MSAEDSIELIIQISIENTSEDDLDRTTRNLLMELNETDVESVDLVKIDSVPAGTKSGDAVLVGTIAVAVLPTLLPKIVELVQAWVMRDKGRTVKFKGKISGQTVEFEGSVEDFQKLLSTSSKAKKNR